MPVKRHAGDQYIGSALKQNLGEFPELDRRVGDAMQQNECLIGFKSMVQLQGFRFGVNEKTALIRRQAARQGRVDGWKRTEKPGDG